MSTMPKMNLWIDDFNSDTCFLTNEQLGIYFRLIFFAWSREGYLPKDKDFIYNLAPHSKKETVDFIIKLYWVYEGTDWNKGWYQKRLREEYIRAVNTTAQNKINGSKGGQANAIKNSSERYSESVASKSKSISTSISKLIYINEFNLFWEEVINKVGKGHSRRNYNKLDKEWALQPKELAEKYNEHYNSISEKKFVKQPAFWLSDEKYLDERPQETTEKDAELIHLKSWVEKFKNPNAFAKDYAKKNASMVRKMVEKGMITNEDVKKLGL